MTTEITLKTNTVPKWLIIRDWPDVIFINHIACYNCYNPGQCTPDLPLKGKCVICGSEDHWLSQSSLYEVICYQPHPSDIPPVGAIQVPLAFLVYYFLKWMGQIFPICKTSQPLTLVWLVQQLKYTLMIPQSHPTGIAVIRKS